MSLAPLESLGIFLQNFAAYPAEILYPVEFVEHTLDEARHFYFKNCIKMIVSNEYTVYVPNCFLKHIRPEDLYNQKVSPEMKTSRAFFWGNQNYCLMNGLRKVYPIEWNKLDNTWDKLNSLANQDFSNEFRGNPRFKNLINGLERVESERKSMKSYLKMPDRISKIIAVAAVAIITVLCTQFSKLRSWKFT